MSSIKKKWILITGAGSELAFNILRELNTKYNYILIGKNKKNFDKIKKNLKKLKFITITSDVCDENMHKKIENISKIKKIKIYGAINFVGMHSFKPLKLISYDNFEKIYKNNVYSFINLMKFFAINKNITTQKNSIINISSVSSLRGNKFISLYSSSKAAANNLSKSFAIELSMEGVRVNSILLGHYEKGLGKITKKFLNNNQLNLLKSQHLLGFGNINTLMGGINFLLEEKNDWITGAEINIDGGFAA